MDFERELSRTVSTHSLGSTDKDSNLHHHTTGGESKFELEDSSQKNQAKDIYF